MPDMTSPLRALRFSGRLMVIQNACPRFSSFTLLLSVIASLRLPLSADISGRMASDCKEDLDGRRGRGGGLFHPDLVVMECSAADRRHRLGAGERIDAAAADMGLVRVNGFRDQHATAQAVEQSCGQRGLAPDIAKRDGIAVRNPQLRRILGMD